MKFSFFMVVVVVFSVEASFGNLNFLGLGDGFGLDEALKRGFFVWALDLVVVLVGPGVGINTCSFFLSSSGIGVGAKGAAVVSSLPETSSCRLLGYSYFSKPVDLVYKEA